jgi:hypothetical protein
MVSEFNDERTAVGAAPIPQMREIQRERREYLGIVSLETRFARAALDLKLPVGKKNLSHILSKAGFAKAQWEVDMGDRLVFFNHSRRRGKRRHGKRRRGDLYIPLEEFLRTAAMEAERLLLAMALTDRRTPQVNDSQVVPEGNREYPVAVNMDKASCTAVLRPEQNDARHDI